MAILLGLFVASAGAQPLHGVGACRDGEPQGGWRLTGARGDLRAIGAFAVGKRTGSFIFWNEAGVRIAHLPYEEDALNGTLALWYGQPGANGDGPQRLEAVYAHGKLNGGKRSWYPDGRLRGEYQYANGVLVEARAWDEQGSALPDARARSQASADFAADASFLRTLEDLVNRHRPCGARVIIRAALQ